MKKKSVEVKPGLVLRKDGPWDWWRVEMTQFPSDKHYDGGLPGVVVAVSRPSRRRKGDGYTQAWDRSYFIPARNPAAFLRWAMAENRRPA